jgi:hypothetical protein
MAMTAHHATIKFLYAVDCNDHSNEPLIARSINNEHILLSYRKGSNDNDIFDVAKSVSKPSQDARMQQSNFYMLSFAIMMASCLPFYVVL